MRTYTQEEIDNIIRSRVPEFIGDSGYGGKKGTAPAPPAGSSGLDMVLHADGTWSPQAAGANSGYGTSVKEYGAYGDGVQDDTDAIQDTIDAVNAAGGGVVYFPKGTYLIRIANTPTATWHYAITMYAGIVLVGESKENTTIKVKDGAGNYVAILTSPTVGTIEMNDIGVYNLGFDQNYQGNELTAIEDLTDAYNGRLVIYFKGKRISVKNCKFFNLKNVNTISMNAPYLLCYDVWISDNLFELAPSNIWEHDHSTIYTNASNVIISNNIFRSPAMNTLGARTAIEVHGDANIVIGNSIINFLKGANVTGVAFKSDNVIFSYNSIENCQYGIGLWSWFYGGNVSDPGMVNCVVSNNKIVVDRDAWNAGGVRSAYGIGLDSTGTAPIVGIQIVNNTIVFRPTSIGVAEDNGSAGVALLRTVTGGTGYNENITVSGNIITSPIGCGIDLRLPCLNLKCEGNIISNPGQSKYGPLSSSFRVGILAFPVAYQINWHVKNNILADNQNPPTMSYGFTTGSYPAVNCSYTDNTWYVPFASGGNSPYVGNATSGAAWFVSQVMEDYSSHPPVSHTKAGSYFIESNTGIKRVQTTVPQGGTYADDSPNFYPAYEIPYGNISSTGGLSSSTNFRYTAGSLVLTNGQFYSNGTPSVSHGILFATNGVQKSNFGSAGTEAGSDTGADIYLRFYNDSGVFIDTPTIWQRAAGKPVTMYRPLAINNNISGRVVYLTSGNRDASISDSVITYTGSGGNLITAPPASAIGSGRSWEQIIRNGGTGVITYAPSGSNTIDYLTSPVKIYAGEEIKVTADGISKLHISSSNKDRHASNIASFVDVSVTGDAVSTIDRMPIEYVIDDILIWSESGTPSGASLSIFSGPNATGTQIISSTSLAALSGANNVIRPTVIYPTITTLSKFYVHVDVPSIGASQVHVMVNSTNLRL